MSPHLSDEEQIERFKAFLKRYGNAMITGVLLALIAYFGWQYWQKKQAVERFNLAAQYQQVMDAEQRLAANPDNQALRTQYFSKADTLVKAHPDTAQAILTQLLSAKLAALKDDYATAEKQLAAATQSKIKDQGLKQLAWLRLAHMQMAQGKDDPALTSLKQVTEAAFLPASNEIKGDILVQKNDMNGAKAAYQAAWDALAERKEPRQLLRIKLESLGVAVPDLEVEEPIRQPSAEQADQALAQPQPSASGV